MRAGRPDLLMALLDAVIYCRSNCLSREVLCRVDAGDSLLSHLCRCRFLTLDRGRLTSTPKWILPDGPQGPAGDVRSRSFWREAQTDSAAVRPLADETRQTHRLRPRPRVQVHPAARKGTGAESHAADHRRLPRGLRGGVAGCRRRTTRHRHRCRARLIVYRSSSIVHRSISGARSPVPGTYSDSCRPSIYNRESET